MFPWFEKIISIRIINGWWDHKRCMIIPITRHGVIEYASSPVAPVINIQRVNGVERENMSMREFLLDVL